jgi:hypothetical protein
MAIDMLMQGNQLVPTPFAQRGTREHGQKVRATSTLESSRKRPATLCHMNALRRSAVWGALQGESFADSSGVSGPAASLALARQIGCTYQGGVGRLPRFERSNGKHY